MRIVMVIVCSLWLAACGTSTESEDTTTLASLAVANQANLSKLTTGMSKSDVVAVMGSGTAKTHDGIVSNPWSSEAFVGKNGARYEVLSYVTRKNQPFTPVRKTLTTPLILRDGVLIGWGDNALSQLK